MYSMLNPLMMISRHYICFRQLIASYDMVLSDGYDGIGHFIGHCQRRVVVLILKNNC